MIYISPHSVMMTGSLGLLFGPVGTFSILRRVSRPSRSLPKTTCLPSRKSHLAHVMKNCETRGLGDEGITGLRD